MQVLLVNPHYNGQSEIPPLGLLSLAAPLIGAGLDVSILDLDVCPPQEGRGALEKRLKASPPNLVGVTAMSHSFPSALEVCRMAKASLPAVWTVMGGMHATVLGDEILAGHGSVDVCVRGEGELALLELAGRLVAGEPLSGMAGVSYREGGKIIHNPDRPLLKELDDLPAPAHHLVASGPYRTRSLSSSRGCHHGCTFCSIQAQYRRTVRMRDPSALAEEIRTLVALGARRIMFTDDNFTFSLRRVREICARIGGLGQAGGVAFYAEGRIDDVCRNPVMASILSDAGFRGLYIGAESGSQEILDYYRKDTTPEDILRGVSYCVEQNLTPVVNFILCGPRDTPATIQETIRLARQVFERGAEIVYGETLIPYPGTPIQEALLRDGKYRIAEDIYYFTSYHDLDLDRFLRLGNVARAVTRLLHKEDPYYATKKPYYELGYLDELLSGRVPSRFRELQKRSDTMPPEVAEIERYMAAALAGDGAPEEVRPAAQRE